MYLVCHMCISCVKCTSHALYVHLVCCTYILWAKKKALDFILFRWELFNIWKFQLTDVFLAKFHTIYLKTVLKWIWIALELLPKVPQNPTWNWWMTAAKFVILPQTGVPIQILISPMHFSWKILQDGPLNHLIWTCIAQEIAC